MECSRKKGFKFYYASEAKHASENGGETAIRGTNGF